jgi:hypothetical protein
LLHRFDVVFTQFVDFAKIEIFFDVQNVVKGRLVAVVAEFDIEFER